MSGTSRVSSGRRRFVQLVGWASMLAAGGGPALAQVAARRSKRAPPPHSSPSPSPAPKDAPSEEAKALAEVVNRRYGAHLEAGDLESITRDVDGDIQAAKRLRESKLANSDEPDATFRA